MSEVPLFLMSEVPLVSYERGTPVAARHSCAPAQSAPGGGIEGLLTEIEGLLTEIDGLLTDGMGNTWTWQRRSEPAMRACVSRRAVIAAAPPSDTSL